MGTITDSDEVRTVFNEISQVGCDENGVLFDQDTIAAPLIRGDQAYRGVRVTVDGFIGRARVPRQIDVGFADIVTPESGVVEIT